MENPKTSQENLDPARKVLPRVEKHFGGERKKWNNPGVSPLKIAAFQRYANNQVAYLPPNVIYKERRECRKYVYELIRCHPMKVLHSLRYNSACFKYLHPRHCQKHTPYYLPGKSSDAICIYCRSPFLHGKTSSELNMMNYQQRCHLGLHSWKPVDDHQYSLRCIYCNKTDPHSLLWGPITDQDLLAALT